MGTRRGTGRSEWYRFSPYSSARFPLFRLRERRDVRRLLLEARFECL